MKAPNTLDMIKKTIFPLLILFLNSCAPEDDYVENQIEQVFTKDIETEIIVDLKYVVSNEIRTKNIYALNEEKFISHLNGSYFHRHAINFTLGTSQTFLSDELFDLTDNRGEEALILKQQTKTDYNPKRLTIYIMLRRNTVALGGVAVNRRALITDEMLFQSTAPHEIGHALGLHHKSVHENIMSEFNPHLRTEFDSSQVEIMKNTITEITK